MIETIGTYAELPYAPAEIEGWLRDHADTWRVTENVATGGLQGVLAGVHTDLGKVTVGRHRDQEEGSTAYVMLAEGNLLTLAHGHRAKHLTLKARDVGAGIEAYRSALSSSLPIAPVHQRLVRVDASVTWRRSEQEASRQLGQGSAALHAARSGRRMVARYGVEGTTLVHGKRLTDRVYDKSAESLAAAKKSRQDPPDLGSGRLVRFERQMRSATARKHYGEDLEALDEQGAIMARTAVVKATDTYSAQDTHGTPDHLYARLVDLGASPTEAARLMGPAQLLAAGGVPALTRFGMSDSSAYRLRARIRSLYGEPEDDGDRYAEHEAEQESLADLWDVDDAEFA